VDNLTALVAFLAELVTLAGVITPVIVTVRKVASGTRCQLRSEMLRIYYHNREKRQIRQYEYENFVMLYEAYRALKANGFIERISAEVKEWDIIT
jgi:hypothetical protein